MVDFQITNLWDSVTTELLNGRSVLVSAPKGFGKKTYINKLTGNKEIKARFEKIVNIKLAAKKLLTYSTLWSYFVAAGANAKTAKVRRKEAFITALIDELNTSKWLIIVNADHSNKDITIKFLNMLQDISHDVHDAFSNCSVLAADDLSLYLYERTPQSDHSLWDFLTIKILMPVLSDANMIGDILLEHCGSECASIMAPAILEMTGGNHGLVYAALRYSIEHNTDCRNKLWPQDCRNYLLTTHLMTVVKNTLLDTELDFVKKSVYFMEPRLFKEAEDRHVMELHRKGIIVSENEITLRLCGGVITEVVKGISIQRLKNQTSIESSRLSGAGIIFEPPRAETRNVKIPTDWAEDVEALPANGSFRIENAYGLIIGVGSQGIELTAKDANDVYDILVNENLAGYSTENVALLTRETATKSNIMAGLQQLIERIEQVQDATVFVYYSGHGTRQYSALTNDEQIYLVTHGADMADPDGTMVSAAELSDKIAKIESTRLLVLMDCCYSAGLKTKSSEGVDTIAAPDPSSNVSGSEFIRALRNGKGRVFISSCGADEESFILPGGVNSLFTEVLLEGLEGSASGTAPFVRVIDLMHLLLTEVSQRIGKFQKPQNPVINDVRDLNSAYAICLNSNAYAKAGARAASAKGAGKTPTDEKKLEFLDNYPAKIKESASQLAIIQYTGEGEPLSLLERGELKEAINQMMGMSKQKKHQHLYEGIILLNQRFDTFERDEALGLLTYDEAIKERMKITRAALFFARKMS